MPNKKNWKEEYDKEFPCESEMCKTGCICGNDEIKDFIRQKLAAKDQWAAKELERLNGNILSPKMYSFDEVKKLIQQAKEEVVERMNAFIAEELLICHKEGTPTSRLTSLSVKLQTLK